MPDTYNCLLPACVKKMMEEDDRRKVINATAATAKKDGAAARKEEEDEKANKSNPEKYKLEQEEILMYVIPFAIVI